MHARAAHNAATQRARPPASLLPPATLLTPPRTHQPTRSRAQWQRVSREPQLWRSHIEAQYGRTLLACCPPEATARPWAWYAQLATFTKPEALAGWCEDPVSSGLSGPA